MPYPKIYYQKLFPIHWVVLSTTPKKIKLEKSNQKKKGGKKKIIKKNPNKPPTFLFFVYLLVRHTYYL